MLEATPSHGFTPGELRRYLKSRVTATPRLLRIIIQKALFSKKEKKREKTSSNVSQKRQYPDDFVFVYVEGDGKEFDYGIDFSECAMCKFYREQNAVDFLPYICLTDKIFSEAFGYGFVRTKTLAEGFDKCDFRFKKHGETRVGSTVWKNEFDES